MVFDSYWDTESGNSLKSDGAKSYKAGAGATKLLF